MAHTLTKCVLSKGHGRSVQNRPRERRILLDKEVPFSNYDEYWTTGVSSEEIRIKRDTHTGVAYKEKWVDPRYEHPRSASHGRPISDEAQQGHRLCDIRGISR